MTVASGRAVAHRALARVQSEVRSGNAFTIAPRDLHADGVVQRGLCEPCITSRDHAEGNDDERGTDQGSSAAVAQTHAEVYSLISMRVLLLDQYRDVGGAQTVLLQVLG